MDFFHAAHALRERVLKDSLENKFGVSLYCGLYSHLFQLGRMGNECRKMSRQCVCSPDLYAVPVNYYGNFNTCSFIYIGNISVISQIGVERERRAVSVNRVENIRSVFFSAFKFLCRYRF